MTVEELWQSSLLRFAMEPSNSRFSDDFYGALNDSQNEFCITRGWGFLRTTGNLTTVTDTRTVALPSDFGHFYDVRGCATITSPTANSGTVVQIMSFEEWTTNEWEDGTDTGTPEFVYLLGSSAYFSPVPDAAYTVSIIYYKRPTTIADTSTDLTLPTAYHECLKRMVFRRLQSDGYSSITEMQISDADIARLMGVCAKDDIQRYGGLTFNLNKNSYSRSTV